MQNIMAKVIGANCGLPLLIPDCLLLQTAWYTFSMRLTCCMCIEGKELEDVRDRPPKMVLQAGIPPGLCGLFQRRPLLVIWTEVPCREQQGQRAGLSSHLLPLPRRQLGVELL